MSVVAYWNGSFVEPEEGHLPIDERGHQFGDGVYEVVRVYGGKPFLLDMHLGRLDDSLRLIGIENPHTRDEWARIIYDAIRESHEPEALVYWQVTRGIAPRSHLFPSVAPSVSLTVRPFSPSEATSMTLLALPDERWANVFVKSLNLLPNVLAKEAANRAGANEALLVRDGRVTEGSSSNVWFVRGAQIITAPANRFILNGISRRFTLELTEKLGLSVTERALSWDEISTVDEVFMTGTTIEIMPVSEIMMSANAQKALYHLPDVPTGNLMDGGESVKTVWTARTSNRIARELRKAFLDEVERFRHQAKSVAGR